MMKRLFLKFEILIIVFFISSTSFAQLAEKVNDTLSAKEHRKYLKEERKTELKASHKQFVLRGTSVFASLNTQIRFDLPPDGLFTANIDLESDFGLEDRRSFIMGSFLYFITPQSGIYAQYYNINRQNVFTTEKEYTFLNTTIPIGTEVTAYFDTRVFSVGYLLTLLRDTRVFFGAYFNVYFLELGTGIYGTEDRIDDRINFLAPLPNFGFIANFKLRPWLYFDTNIGFFSISLDGIPFGAGIYNVDASLVFKPTEWLGVNLGYQMFDVNIDTVVDIGSTEIPTNIEYHFYGPSLGLSFNF